MSKYAIISSVLLFGVAVSITVPHHHSYPSLDPRKYNKFIAKARDNSFRMMSNPFIRDPFEPDSESMDFDVCKRVSCTAPEDKCTLGSSYCQSGTSCLDGVCRTSIAGDACDDENECTGDFICDKSTSKCVAKPTLDEPCSSYVGCSTGYYCSNSKCVENPTKVGDACEESFFGGDNCPREMKCFEGVCVQYPSIEGTECNASIGCGNSLYCDNETNICKTYPKAGETCINEMCYGNLFSGLYCDDKNTCKELKKEGEKCSDTDLCDYNYYCNDDNVCQKYEDGGRCYSDNDCEGLQSCFKNKCVGYFSLGDGMECPEVSTDDMESFFDMFLCKEGYGCVPDRSTEYGHVCKKIETKLEDNIKCEMDSDCPIDSKCSCNTITGEKRCLPYATSSKKNFDVVTEYLIVFINCMFGECDQDKLFEMSMNLASTIADPTVPEIRCYANSIHNSSSASASYSSENENKIVSYAKEMSSIPFIFFIVLVIMFI